MFRSYINDEILRWRRSLPKPKFCSSRIPMKTRLSIFASKWTRPACNQMHETSLQPWWWCTTLSQLRPPNLSNLCKNGEKGKRLDSIVIFSEKFSYSRSPSIHNQTSRFSITQNYQTYVLFHILKKLQVEELNI